MYTSFFKRQRQYDTFKAKELSIERYCHNKRRARYACIPRSLSVSDNMTRLKRKKLSIERYCHNKRRARYMYTCILRSLSVSDNMTRLKRNKLSIESKYRIQGQFFKVASFEWLGGSSVNLKRSITRLASRVD